MASLRRRRFEQRFLEKWANTDMVVECGLLQRVFLVRESFSGYDDDNDNASTQLRSISQRQFTGNEEEEGRVGEKKEVLVLMQIFGTLPETKPKVVQEEKKWAREFFDECVEEGILMRGRVLEGGSLEERRIREMCAERYWDCVRDTLENVRRSGCKYLKVECEVCGGVVV